jgi:hypothetical protein
MKNQLIIIDTLGGFDAERVARLVAVLSKEGLQVKCALVRHESNNHFAVGTHDDLVDCLTRNSMPVALATAADVRTGGTGEVAASGVTLETVHTNVLQVLALLQPAPLGQTAVLEPTPKKKKKGAGVEEKLLPEPPKEALLPTTTPPDGVEDTTGDEASGPGRDIKKGALGETCTVCGEVFEDEALAEDHLNGPMCAAKVESKAGEEKEGES